ncbi:MAG: hypothetical protein LBN08_01720 [Lactobacillales bacterium]|jgi:DNA-binding CsgD family transcriptional regulator|nr:hypothetical protein [Lactobacillales bacterium]
MAWLPEELAYLYFSMRRETNLENINQFISDEGEKANRQVEIMKLHNEGLSEVSIAVKLGISVDELNNILEDGGFGQNDIRDWDSLTVEEKMSCGDKHSFASHLISEGVEAGLDPKVVEGMIKGMRKGMWLGRKMVLEDMLAAGKTAEEIADDTQIPIYAVAKILKQTRNHSQKGWFFVCHPSTNP